MNLSWTEQMRKRVVLIISGLVFLFTILSLRLLEVQVGKHSHYLSKAAGNHTFRKVIHARRGDILDRNGNLLASSIPQKTVQADLLRMRQILQKNRETKNRKKTFSLEIMAELLAPHLEMTPKEILERLNDARSLVVLKKKVELSAWDKIEALKLPGILGVDEYQRHYPEGRNASHVLGYVDSEGNGKDGIEASMNHYLKGVDGWFVSERDASRREIRAYRSQDAPVKNGYSISLALDQTIQYIVEEELDKAMETYKPVATYAIVMKPSTGEILALANRPTYDPNERASLTWEGMRNRCVTDTFEPGSTFKIVTTAATLNEGLVMLDTPIFCENGVWFWAGSPLRDHGSYGELTVEQVLQKSSNIGFAKMALKLGDQLLYRYIRDFGFGQTVLNQILPGEQIGTLRPVARWSKLSITRVPIGYEVAATPLQMITAMSAIANDGMLMRPMLINEVLDEEGNVVARYSPRVAKQVIQPEIARQVVKALSAVVSREGTASKAAVEGFTVAGKTGTSRKWDNEAKQYSHQRYLASFIGFLPASHPEFALLTIIDEPSEGGIYGGQVAAPVFSAMASRIARHLDLNPETSFWEVASR